MASPLGEYLQAQSGALEIQRQREAIPLQRQQNQLAIQQMEQQLDAGTRQKALQGAQVMGQFLQRVKEIPDPQQRLMLFQRSIPELKKFGIDLPPPEKITLESVSDTGLIPLETGIGRALQQNTAELQGIEGKAKALVGAMNPETGKPFTLDEAKQAIILRNERIVPGAASTEAIMLANDPALRNRVAEARGQVKQSEETAKLTSRLELEPEIADRVELAKERAKSLAAIEDKERSNARAKAVYEVGVKNLVDAFGKATTGPGFGLIPAITEDQRVLDGAIKLMGPMLKDVFRSAGEGTFTEGDRIQLEQLLPDRGTPFGAAIRQVEQVDSIVQTKLGGDPRSVEELLKGTSAERRMPQAGGQGTQQQQKTGGQIMQDANGNRAMVYPDGSFEEIR